MSKDNNSNIKPYGKMKERFIGNIEYPHHITNEEG